MPASASMEFRASKKSILSHTTQAGNKEVKEIVSILVTLSYINIRA